MTLDSAGVSLAVDAAIVATAALVLYAAGGTRLGSLVGVRPDPPMLLPPMVARLLGLVVGYLALLVVVGGLVHARMESLDVGHPTLIALGAVALWAAGTASRVVRHAGRLMGWRTAVEGTLEPEEIVAVDHVGNDLDLRTALRAASDGDWRPAAALLSATRDVDVRMDRIRTLTTETLEDARWVEEWRAADPHGALPTAVAAELRMQRSWAARGHYHAYATSQEQFEAFATGLDETEELAEEAARLDPEDPTPWATLVEIARGQGVSQREFDRRVEGLLDRAPHHVHGSFAVLQAVCAKWRGSTEIMFACARDLAASAPMGSATCLLPLMAHVEHHTELTEGRGGHMAADRHMTADATRAELRAATDRWLAGPDGGPRPGGQLFGHNLAAYAFWLADDPDAARPHLEAIGRSVTRLPWSYHHEPGEALGVVRKWAGLAVVAPTLQAV